MFHRDGAWGLLRLTLKKFQMTWRRGEVWEIGRFWGHSSEIVRLDGCKFTIDKSVVPPNVIDLLLSNMYEKPERDALKTFLNPELPVIELGACLGIVSCLSNRMLRQPTKHVVVEANPALLPILRRNRDQNGCHFQIVQAALAHSVETVAFKISDNVLASSVHGEEHRAVLVPAVTLDLLVNDYGFERCTLVCDIEGAELELVENEITILSERVDTLIMELHDRLVGEGLTQNMLTNLERAGFKIIHKCGDIVVLANRKYSDNSVQVHG